MSKENPTTIEDKLGLLSYNWDKNSHISVDQDKFKADKLNPKPITFVCPAKVYEEDPESGECIVNHENCVECGTCHVASPEYVNWFYPIGGKGVKYKYS